MPRGLVTHFFMYYNEYILACVYGLTAVTVTINHAYTPQSNNCRFCYMSSRLQDTYLHTYDLDVSLKFKVSLASNTGIFMTFHDLDMTLKDQVSIRQRSTYIKHIPWGSKYWPGVLVCRLLLPSTVNMTFQGHIKVKDVNICSISESTARNRFF